MDEITKQVRETLDKEYKWKFNILHESSDRDHQVQEEKYKKDLKIKDKHYDGLLNQALAKVKIDYDQKLKEVFWKTEVRFRKQQEEHRAQLEALNLELEEWKHKPNLELSSSKSNPVEIMTAPARDTLGNLKKEFFNFLPGTVKTERGSVSDNTNINWDETASRPKHVTFATSTPRVTSSDMVGLVALLAAETFSGQSIGIGESQSTLINLASEFKKMREPKLQKLKGGNTSSTQLFIMGWIKEVHTVICNRELTNSEGVQLICEFMESKAHQQVDFYINMNCNPTIEGVLDHLISTSSSGEDESSIKSKFYSRKQLAGKSEDDYAEVLQILERKIIIANPAFQAECNGVLVHQFTNGLCKDIIRPLAKDILFIKFRAEVANLSGSRLKCSITKVTTNTVKDDDDSTRPLKKNKRESPLWTLK